ncbi:MAG TPA: hypothetical protein VIN73_01210 [Vicingaceae bacterium]
MEQELEVNSATQYVEVKVSIWVKIINWIRIITFFFIGCFLSYQLYDKCLYCENCHIVVTIHYSVLSMICFVTCGIPVDKVLKINGISGV